MTGREYKAACAWNHIKQAGSTIATRKDGLMPGYRELKKLGLVTIEGSTVRLCGSVRRAFLDGETLPAWSDIEKAK